MRSSYVWLSLTIFALVSGMVGSCLSKSYREEYERTMLNYKAELNQKDSMLVNSRRMYQMSLTEIEVSKDSITQELMKTVDSLKIKNKKLSQVQWIESRASKIDTLILRDTILREGVKIDTTMSDKWYSLNLRLSYPDTIVVSPSFVSEKHIIVHSKRETIKPPKKFFLLRWFQKKHTVVKVEVAEKNPYINSIENKFIEIVK